MEENLANRITSHKLLLVNRSSMSLTGVLDVISFDLKEILLESQEGMIVVRGNNLHIQRLSVEKGEVDIDGTIDSLQYSNLPKKGDSLWGRLFK